MRTINRISQAMKSLLLMAVLISCGLTDEEIATMDMVRNVDLERYAGKWYEIARFPHRFEKDLVGVTATYTLRPDGKIGVLNEGYQHTLGGKHKKAKAFAKVPDENNSGRLKVYFFWPFCADYLILELDRDHYQYALVGSSSDDYLWILCRQPAMDEDTYRMLVDRAAERGYDVSRLQMVPQRAD